MHCPKCTHGKLYLKDEATYVYTYDIQTDGQVKWKNDEGYLSYLFIDREQKDFRQYVQCNACKEIYHHDVENKQDMEMIILKKAVHYNGEISNEFMI